MNKAQLAEALTGTGVNLTSEQVNTIYAKIDQVGILQKQRERIRIDLITKADLVKGMAINNVPGSVWLAQPGVSYLPDEAKIVLIYVDGELSAVQMHSPYAAGFRHFTDADADPKNPSSHIQRLIEDRAQDLADTEILRLAKEASYGL